MAALDPRSRRPLSSPNRINESLKQQALDTRSALERSGLDFGPISVFDKMRSLGMDPPSVASLARIFRQRGVARLEPRKKPRAAYRRFVYPEPNGCWQLDATEYVLVGGRKCVIFQLEDDHSRLAVASHVAQAETSEAALAVMDKGIAAHGVPQRLLTDNGSALNPIRRGWISQLVAYVSALGVKAITGRPGKPTTQGKNERFHQTLFRWLDKHPIARTIAELQELVDDFDVIYNTERPHQGLPGRDIPQRVWDRTPPAEAPRPVVDPPDPVVPGITTFSAARLRANGTATRVVHPNGCVAAIGVTYYLSSTRAGQTIHLAWDDNTVVFADEDGQVLLEKTRPPQGVRYVGNGGSESPQT